MTHASENPPVLPVCPRCQLTFAPQGAQRTLLDLAHAKGMKLVMLECPHCLHTVPHHPDADATAAPEPEPAPAWRCPTLGCCGWVCDIADRVAPGEPSLGCGECGACWADLAALKTDVRAISARFAHRRGAYRVTATRVSPVPAHRQPKRYDAQVWQERNGEAPG